MTNMSSLALTAVTHQLSSGTAWKDGKQPLCRRHKQQNKTGGCFTLFNGLN